MPPNDFLEWQESVVNVLKDIFFLAYGQECKKIDIRLWDSQTKRLEHDMKRRQKGIFMGKGMWWFHFYLKDTKIDSIKEWDYDLFTTERQAWKKPDTWAGMWRFTKFPSVPQCYLPKQKRDTYNYSGVIDTHKLWPRTFPKKNHWYHRRKTKLRPVYHTMTEDGFTFRSPFFMPYKCKGIFDFKKCTLTFNGFDRYNPEPYNSGPFVCLGRGFYP